MAKSRCARFGAQLERKGNEVRIRGGQRLHGVEALVPGDLSSAAFFFARLRSFRLEIICHQSAHEPHPGASARYPGADGATHFL